MYEKELTNDLIKELQSKTSALLGIQALKELGNAKLNDGLNLLNDYLKESVKRDVEQVRLELAVEYAGLFLSVWGKPAHPSESAYASGGKLIMQKERDEVLAMYRAAKVEKVKEFTEPEDHVAVELHFLSHLAGETAKSAADKDMQRTIELIQTQRSFLKQHLGKWMGALAKDVVKEGRAPFYKGISLIAEGFIEEDVKVLDDISSEMRPQTPSTS